MSDTELRTKELKRTIRLLREIETLAERAYSTGALQSGASQAVRQFNAVLKRMETISELPEGIFLPLAEDSSFDAVGVVAAQLAAYLHEDEEQEKDSSQHFVPTININGPVGSLSDLEQLRELGKAFRENMPSWFTKQGSAVPEEKPATAEPVAEAAPAPAETPVAAPVPSPAPRAALLEAAHPANFAPDPAVEWKINA